TPDLDYTNPTTANLYTYTANNPIGMIDPNGLNPGGTCVYGDCKGSENLPVHGAEEITVIGQAPSIANHDPYDAMLAHADTVEARGPLSDNQWCNGCPPRHHYWDQGMAGTYPSPTGNGWEHGTRSDYYSDVRSVAMINGAAAFLTDGASAGIPIPTGGSRGGGSRAGGGGKPSGGGDGFAARPGQIAIGANAAGKVGALPMLFRVDYEGTFAVRMGNVVTYTGRIEAATVAAMVKLAKSAGIKKVHVATGTHGRQDGSWAGNDPRRADASLYSEDFRMKMESQGREFAIRLYDMDQAQHREFFKALSAERPDELFIIGFCFSDQCNYR
ncbi:hypothetical protein, partial [Catellatospora sp. NPDC049609]|uniref:hypothetical protein n=1 Tax=Catellatospora sp. NPDC049609 TaxID=3155505 RepID=UPI0034211AFB